MSFQTRLDSLHRRVKRIKVLSYFTVFNRVMLAIAFIPSGTTKLLGFRFTLLPVDTQVGFFFESFYQAGGWYRAVGFFQVLAAVLLLIPRTATLGAVIFFPIVLNVVLVTIYVGFGGTWVITSLMLTANLYLICWDYDRIKFVLPFPRNQIAGPFRHHLPLTIVGCVIGIFSFLFFSGITTYFGSLGVWGAIGGAVLGGLFGYLNSKELRSDLELASSGAGANLGALADQS